MKIFGFEIKRTDQNDGGRFAVPTRPGEVVPTPAQSNVVLPTTNNTPDIASSLRYQATVAHLDPSASSLIELIDEYRKLEMSPEIDEVITDIIDAAVFIDGVNPPVQLNFTGECKLPSDTKDKITNAFAKCVKLLGFNQNGKDLFKRWYVDGRLAYHMMFNSKNRYGGITELVPLDPRFLLLIREVYTKTDDKGNQLVDKVLEAWKYTRNITGIPQGNTTSYVNNAGWTTFTQDIILTKDSVIFAHSGKVDTNRNLIVGFLEPVIRPANLLHMCEDSIAIYRWSRAPERRVFKIDPGQTPNHKAEAMLQEQMARYQNKTNFDPATGRITSSKAWRSILEDFWILKRGQTDGTDITTLPGGQNLGEIDDLKYFLNKIYRSLKWPASRRNTETRVGLGRVQDVSRDEMRFSTFITGLRTRFNDLFFQLLRTELILTGVVNSSEWDELKEQLLIKYTDDVSLAEIKQTELWLARAELLDALHPWTEKKKGEYFTRDFIRNDLLAMDPETDTWTDDDEKKNQKREDRELEGDSGFDDGGGGGPSRAPSSFGGGGGESFDDLSPEGEEPNLGEPSVAGEEGGGDIAQAEIPQPSEVELTEPESIEPENFGEAEAPEADEFEEEAPKSRKVDMTPLSKVLRVNR